MKNDQATKKDLKDLEERIDKKFNNFDEKITKRLNDSFEAFRQENAYQFQLMREDLRTEMSRFTNMILTAIDPLVKELETRQQDREMTTAQISDLDRRVTKLENA